MRELDVRHDQRQERSPSDGLAKCHCIDTSKNEFRKYRIFEAGGLVMKIVWRNSKPIDHTSFSIMKTLGAEQPDELRVFYRSSRGLGALGTIFELLVNHDAASRAP